MGGSDPRVEFLKITKDKISTALREFIADLIDIGIVSEKFYKEVRQKGVSKDLKELANVTHGFVGADLSALAKEAAMIVLRKVLPDLKLREDDPLPKELLEKLGYHQFDIKLICAFIARHHERLNDPHDIFKILYDSDHLVMLSKEEFKIYDSRAGFEWENMINGFYNAGLKEQAVRLLKERSDENGKKKK